MPPKNTPRPRPKERGEEWELRDGRIVTLLALRGVTKTKPKIRFYEVFNGQGKLECLTEDQFRKQVEPKAE